MRRSGTAAAVPADWYRHSLPGLLSRFLSGLPEPGPAGPGPALFWTGFRLAAVALLIAWDVHPAVCDRFAAARAALAGLWPGTPAGGETYQGWVRALCGKAGTGLAAALAAGLRAATDALAARFPRCRYRALAADGSRFDAPRTAANRGRFGSAGRRGTAPQMQATVLWCMSTGLPWDWRIGPGTDAERTHLRAMLPALPAGTLLVADAGFAGYALLREALSGGRHVLMRAGANVRLLRKLGWAAEERGSTVYLWPDAGKAGPPLTLRLVRVPVPGKKDVCLLTDLAEEELSDAEAAALYRMRWGVEVFFRAAKQTLERRRMLSASPDRARTELEWSLLAAWLTGLAGAESAAAAGRDPLQASFAAALRAARTALRRPWRAGGFAEAMGRAFKDRCVRRSAKKARAWPHKKRERPPGEPSVRDATGDQRRRARLLRAASAA